MTRILENQTPADHVLVSTFREPRFRHFGKQDRQRLFNLIYTFLRYRTSLSLMAESKEMAAMFSYLSDSVVNQPNLSFALARQAAFEGKTLPNELPDWLTEQLLKQYPEAEVRALAQSLLETAPVDFRVNLLKTDRNSLVEKLRKAGIRAEATPYSPWGIRVSDKADLTQSDSYCQGLMEVQDEGSQLIALLLGTKRNEWVIDFCAGAGGKTLAIGAMMRATGRLYALDTSTHRLSSFQPRLLRSGLKNVVCHTIEDVHDARLAKWHERADRVLIDAPCSSLGTLRRNPALKWQYRPADIEHFSLLQKNILEAASALVKPGGVLVYATCSLLNAENEAVVNEFLAHHPEFVRESAKSVFEKQGIDIPCQDDLILLPNRHQTDGFYAARLKRQKGSQ